MKLKHILFALLTVTLIAAAMSVSVGATLDDGLVLYYTFDEVGPEVVDEKGNLHLSVEDSSLFTDDAMIGHAIQLDGTSYLYAELSETLLSPSETGFTVSAYVVIYGNSGADNTLFSWGSNDGVWCFVQSGSSNFGIQSNSGRYPYAWNNHDARADKKNDIEDSWEYHHVAVSYEPTECTVTFYIDGVSYIGNDQYNPIPSEEEGYSTGHVFSDLTGVFSIGGTNLRDSGFNGAIDEVRVYNRALNPDEIAAIIADADARAAADTKDDTTEETEDTTEDTEEAGNTTGEADNNKGDTTTKAPDTTDDEAKNDWIVWVAVAAVVVVVVVVVIVVKKKK